MPSAGQVIRADDVSVQGCRVTRTVAQPIPNSTNTAVEFDEEFFDTDGMHSTVTLNTRITINTAGIYVVGFGAEFTGTGNYTRVLAFLRTNGTAEIAYVQSASQGADPVPQRLNLSTVCQFVVGDYIEALVFQVNSVAATRDLVRSTERSPIFYAARIGS